MTAVPNETRLQPWIEQLKALPGIQEVRVMPEPRTDGLLADGMIEVRTGEHWRRFYFEQKKARRLNEAILHVIRRMKTRDTNHPWILFAEHVTPEMGRRLEADGINYLDRQGNCDIRLPKNNLLIHVEGRRPLPLPVRGRGIGAPGYKVLFALLAREELVAEPVRTIATVAEVGKTTAAEMLDRLRDDGHVLKMRGKDVLVRLEELRDRWLIGYADVLRPKLLVRTYDMGLDVAETVQRLEEHPPVTTWAWGGAVAAERMIHHYRGDRVVLHTTELPATTQQNARLLPARDGNFIVVAPPCGLAWEGRAPHLAHPLLVYAELLQEAGERPREAAEMIRARFVEHQP